MIESRQTSGTKRLAFIDNAKGLAILLVVLGHIVQFMYAPVDYQQNVLFRYIYSFHMPLFFILSGMVTKVVSPNSLRVVFDKLRKRFLQLVIPFCTWGVIRVMMSPDISLYMIFIKPDRSLWFLWTLFFINFFYWSVLFIFNKTPLGHPVIAIVCVYIVIIILALVLRGNFGTDSFQLFYPYFVIGLILGGVKTRISHIPWLRLITGVLGVIWVILAWKWYLSLDNIPSTEPQWVYILNSGIMRRMIAVLGSLFFILLFVALEKKKDKLSRLTKLGMITLPVYAIHQTVIRLIIRIIPESTGPLFSTYVGGFLSFCIVLLLTLMTYRLLQMNKISKILFLGE